ncbi:MAG TPA: GldM family protein, partial [Bacteroidales bacterium]|nr:GldM family protein [Bacteroidales bacterium]
LAVSSIIPKMPEDFDFDLNFIVQSFTFVALKNGDVNELETRGNQLTPAMKNIIKNSRRGDKIWLENIYAKGPDGTNRKLSSISLEIK